MSLQSPKQAPGELAAMGKPEKLPNPPVDFLSLIFLEKETKTWILFAKTFLVLD